jgi:hypothetical protein
LVVFADRFTGPLAVGDVPVKSKCMSEPLTVTASDTFSGLSSMPSLSM